MSRSRRKAAFALLALLAAGSGPVDPTRPEDAGRPLEMGFGPKEEKGLSTNCMWRREKGGWHYSAGHCYAMLPPEKMKGVWITEESSFLPGMTVLPDANHPLRSTHELELDARHVYRKAGDAPASANGHAYLVTFVGRRTRDPWHFDCYGWPYFSVVADRLISAEYLGAMGKYRFPGPELPRYRPAAGERQGKRWRELEARAAAFCGDGGRSDAEPAGAAG